uniref:protein-disulfide reductase n=1 Tax=Arcella intermedia TaxID=1963864 RepID=A0A6B2LUQ8_9EUKA
MTPKIVQTYNALKSAGKAFEVIFATSDNDEHSFKEYYAEMPWLAFPWKDGRIDELSELYEVEGTPTFVSPLRSTNLTFSVIFRNRKE